MLISKTTTIKHCTYMKKYYEEKGYDMGKKGDIIEIKVEDLSPNSNAIVDVVCDFCGKKFTQKWCKYLSTKDTGTCCKECVGKKAKITNLKKYGVENTSQIKEVKEKRMKTCLERYGETTNLKTEDTKNKIRETCMRRYGVPHVGQSKEFINKRNCTLYKTGKGITSRQQIKICEILNGKLNYPVELFLLDILIEDNIGIEYNGSGHRLSVKTKSITDEEFDRKEKVRDEIITKNGYKIIKLETKKDLIPNKSQLEYIIKISKSRFADGDNIVVFNLDNGIWIK